MRPLLLRVSLAAMFFAHAWLKIAVFTPAGAAKYFESLGLPGFVAYLTMAAEIGGGILLLLGIETRWVALLLVPLMAGTIVLVHGKNGWLFTNNLNHYRQGDPSCLAWIRQLDCASG